MTDLYTGYLICLKEILMTSIKQILDWVYEDEAVPENLVKGKMK
jgi:hypothetical protein